MDCRGRPRADFHKFQWLPWNYTHIFAYIYVRICMTRNLNCFWLYIYTRALYIYWQRQIKSISLFFIYLYVLHVYWMRHVNFILFKFISSGEYTSNSIEYAIFLFFVKILLKVPDFILRNTQSPPLTSRASMYIRCLVCACVCMYVCIFCVKFKYAILGTFENPQWGFGCGKARARVSGVPGQLLVYWRITGDQSEREREIYLFVLLNWWNKQTRIQLNIV